MTAVDLGIPGLAEIQEIGAGGNGVVFRARQVDLDRVVAVKMVHLSTSADAIERFNRECRTMARIALHPGVAPIFASGTSESGKPYLIMPFYQAGSLADRMAQGPVPWAEAVELMAAVADAVQHAHDIDVVHRDLKPDNIMLDDRGQPVVVDFGIAKLVDTEHGQSTGIQLTPSYAPPEAFDGARPDRAYDIYSLGATLHALIAGDLPFSGDGGLLALGMRKATEPPPDLRHLAPDGVCAAIERAMAIDPLQRHPNAVSFGTEITDAAAAADGGGTGDGAADPYVTRLASMPPAAHVPSTEAPVSPAPAPQSSEPAAHGFAAPAHRQPQPPGTPAPQVSQPSPYGQSTPPPQVSQPNPYGQSTPPPVQGYSPPQVSQPNPYGQSTPPPQVSQPNPYGQSTPPQVSQPSPYGQSTPPPQVSQPSPYGQSTPPPVQGYSPPQVSQPNPYGQSTPPPQVSQPNPYAVSQPGPYQTQDPGPYYTGGPIGPVPTNGPGSGGGGRSGILIALAAVIVLGVGGLGALLLVGRGDGTAAGPAETIPEPNQLLDPDPDPDDAEPDPNQPDDPTGEDTTDGEPAGGDDRTSGEATAQDLDLSDCFDFPQTRGIFDTVDRRSCDEPHVAEVVAVFEHPDAGQAYPGVDALVEFALFPCTSAAADYLGVGDEYETELESGLLFPTFDEWADGIYVMPCYVARWDGELLARSVAGAGSDPEVALGPGDINGLHRLFVGDCFNELDELLQLEPLHQPVELADCADVNDGEVVGFVDLLGSDDGLYSFDGLQDEAFANCIGPYEDYTGLALDDNVGLNAIIPSRSEWVDEYRFATCIVLKVEGGEAGSIAG